jgi:Phytochelatin synthase
VTSSIATFRRAWVGEETISRLAVAALAFVFLFAQAPVPTWALEASATSVSLSLTPFASEDGLARLARSDAKVNFPALANEFEAEYNGAFCGPASAAIVLNAIRIRSDDVPRDKSRLRPEDLQYMPPGLDPTIPRFTQDSVITKGKKTRAQVFGEPVAINGKDVRDFG